MMINNGKSQTSKGKEKFNHLSAFIPIKIPMAMLTKNCIPIPAYFNNSLLVSFLVFKIYIIYDLSILQYHFSMLLKIAEPVIYWHISLK